MDCSKKPERVKPLPGLLSQVILDNEFLAERGAGSLAGEPAFVRASLCDPARSQQECWLAGKTAGPTPSLVKLAADGRRGELEMGEIDP